MRIRQCSSHYLNIFLCHGSVSLMVSEGVSVNSASIKGARLRPSSSLIASNRHARAPVRRGLLKALTMNTREDPSKPETATESRGQLLPILAGHLTGFRKAREQQMEVSHSSIRLPPANCPLHTLIIQRHRGRAIVLSGCERQHHRRERCRAVRAREVKHTRFPPADTTQPLQHFNRRRVVPPN
jgi:hypothetical protein